MDRRKLKPGNTLHKQLSTQTSSLTKALSSQSLKENIGRSDSENENVSRKRKNSEDEQEEETSKILSPVKFANVTKRRRNVIDDDEDEDDNSKDSDSEGNTSKRSKDPDNDKFTKPNSNNDPRKRKTANTEEGDEPSGSQGSYVMGLLETLDKSPSQLSQSSTSLANKYRKIDLRAPMGSKNKKTLSKIVAERRNDKAKQNKKPEKSPTNAKKVNSNVANESFSRRKLTPSMPRLASDCSDVNDDEMSFSDSESISSKKAAPKNNGKPGVSSKSKTPSKVTKEKSPQKTPPRQRRDLESPDLSPLKLPSLERRNTSGNKKRTYIPNDDKFIDFLNLSGVTLSTGDNLHIANDHPREVIQKMKDLLNTGDSPLNEMIQCWSNYIDDEDNLKKSLDEIKIETDEGVTVCSKNMSLARLLLHVPQLQVEIMNNMIRRLIDKIMTADSSDDVPWAMQMLQQFRFLDIIVDPDILISRFEDLLSSSPEWFQRDIILYIPDIVTDNLHRTTAEMLTKIMENNKDLTNIILDCIYNLTLGKEYKEELREKVLGLLDKEFEKKIVPAITKFVLSGCSTEAAALKSLKVLRKIDMIPSSKEKLDECYTDQMFMVNAIKMSIELSKEVSQATLSLLKNLNSEALPMDIIILILLYDATSAKKKIVEATLYTHIKDGYFKINALKTFYTGYKEVARSLQNSALSLSINLLKADSPTQVEFGIEWVRNIFISQSDTTHKQREVLERLLNLMGNKDKTVKNALEVLSRMINDEKERQYLKQHSCFLRIFLEKIDNLNFEEVSLLYHILHGLCTQSESIANILNDDLTIIMQKQLCSSKVLSKCKGVLGSVMAIKHLAGTEGRSQDALNQLQKTLKSVKVCTRSQALLYDQLAEVIATTKDIDDTFLSEINNYFQDKFVNSCLTEKLNGLVPKFGLNDSSETGYINLRVGASLSVLFRLICICNIKNSGNLESVDALLGCPILMPDDLDMPEPSTADCMIHCINWFRETISGFVTEKNDMIRGQLFKRLETLMSLQGEFVTMVAMLEARYQPPPCYFHYFPMPPFQRIEMKTGKKKKGKKGKKQAKKGKNKDKDDDEEANSIFNDSILNNSVVSLPEWEGWEMGSELTFKNPAYFRQMDTKIIHLLESDLNTHSTQTSHESITIAQVCFIVKELLHMMNHRATESFIRELIQLLPKICVKLQKVIKDLRKNENTPEKEVVRLILCLLIKLFSWKEFQNAKYNGLLRDGLRTLAGMFSESSALLRSCKDLVTEAYKYFESLEDIATQIFLAVSLVNMCDCLMKHSHNFREHSKEQLAKMAHGFLCLEWINDSQGPPYRAAVKELLTTWIENEPNPLNTVTSILEWLPEQAALLERPNSRLSRMPSVTKANFYLILKQIFVGLVKGIEISLGSAENDPERIRVWKDAASCLDKISNICKSNKNMTYLALFLRYSSILYQNLLVNGMKVLEANVKYETEEVLKVIKLFQTSGRFLRDIFCTARKEKNVTLLKLIPAAKSRRERFIYRVKGMLTANNSIESFWMGNLLNKDLDGEEIPSESSEDILAGSDVAENDTNANDSGANNSGSEIFHSESENDDDDQDEDEDAE